MKIQKQGKRFNRNILSCVLTMLLLVGMFPVNTRAQAAEDQGFSYEIIQNSKAVITGYDGSTTGKLVIPSKVYGFYKVVGIGDFSFMMNENITEVVLPDTIEYIGEQAFAFSALEKITIPGSIKTVRTMAFYFCENLKKVTLLYGVETIEDAAFAGCSALETVEMGSSTAFDGDTIFDETPTSLEVEAPQASPAHDYVVGGSKLTVNPLKVDSPSAYKYIVDEATGEVRIEGYFGDSPNPKIPEKMNGIEVGAIGSEAFKDKPVNKVTLPPTIKTIGANAFAGTGLQEIEIPSGVTGIADHAFDDDANLVIKGNCTALDEYLKKCTKIKFIPYGPGAELYYELKLAKSPELGGTIKLGAAREYKAGAKIDVAAVPKQAEYLFKGWAITPSEYETALEDKNRSETVLTMPARDITLTAQFEKIPPEPLRIRNGVLLAYYGSSKQVVIPATYGVTGQEDPNKVPVTTIGDPSWTNNYGRVFYSGYLEELVIPEGITSITANAFYGANALNQIQVATNNSKFSSENGILYNKDKTVLLCYPAGKTDSEFVVPDSVTKIGSYAFAGNKYLTNVNLNNVKIVESHAFLGCSGLLSTNFSSVEQIGVSAFESCTSLNGITIPSSITSIASAAFRYCRSLSELTWADNVTLTSIESETFRGCTFQQMNIPEGTTTIRSMAFAENQNLQTVELGATLNSYASDALEGCGSLTAIHVKEENDTYSSVDGILFNKAKTVLMTYPQAKAGTEYIVPETVNTLDTAAFAYAKLTTLDLGNVVSIGSKAFTYSRIGAFDLTNITSIGNSAFRGCTNLTEITIPSGITSVGYEWFEYCSNLKTVNLPASITSISSWAFNGCTKLDSIQLPSGVTSIGIYAFSSCNSLVNLVLPTNLTSIGNGAFSYCSSLGEVILPNAITTIGEYAYQSCSSLTSLSFSNSEVNIGNYAFQGCNKITNLTIPDSVKRVGNYAFSGNTGLTNVSIAADVIGVGAFQNCSNLASVTLAEGVQTIDASAFMSAKLTAVALPASLQGLGLRAFAKNPITAYQTAEGSTHFKAVDGVLFNQAMTKLLLYPSHKEGTTYETPAGVAEIENYAFADANQLRKVTFNQDVAKLNHSIFLDTQNLRTVTIMNPETEFVNMTVTPFSYVFSGIQDLSKLIIRGYSGSTTEYEVFKHSQQNLRFASIDQLSSGIVVNTNGEVVGYTGTKTEIFIPSSVNSEMEGITVVDLNGQTITLQEDQVIPVKTIGTLALHNPNDKTSTAYKNITSVKIPLSVTKIKMSAFDGCSGLLSSGLQLPVSVQTIEAYAFKDCTSLTSVTIPKNVGIVGGEGVPDEETSTKVYVSAFFGCTSLKEILVEAGNKNYASVDGVLMNARKNKIYEVPINFKGTEGRYEIPNTVTAIGSSSFYGSTLTTVVIPSSMKSIGVGAFQYAFRGSNINVILSEGIEEICDEAFKACTGLKSITIPASIERIGTNVWKGCTGLDSISVTEGNVKYLAKDGALYAKLEGIEVPSGEAAEQIDGDYIALVRCPANKSTIDWITDINFVEIAVGAFESCRNITSITIPSTVQVIGQSAFSGCINLRNIKLPQNLIGVGANAFSGTSLLDLDLSNTFIGIIDAYAFADASIATLRLPSGLERIEGHAFYNLVAKDITIPERVTFIGDKAFAGDADTYRLETVCIENPAVEISGEPFCNISTLTICGDAGSTAEAYCEGKNIKFKVHAGTAALMETAEPTETVEPTQTVEPTETVEPTQTVEPTETVEPTGTAEPTETVEPTEMAEPTQTVEPTEALENLENEQTVETEETPEA